MWMEPPSIGSPHPHELLLVWTYNMGEELVHNEGMVNSSLEVMISNFHY